MQSHHAADPNPYYYMDKGDVSRILLGRVGELVLWMVGLLVVLIIAAELILS